MEAAMEVAEAAAAGWGEVLQEAVLGAASKAAVQKEVACWAVDYLAGACSEVSTVAVHLAAERSVVARSAVACSVVPMAVDRWAAEVDWAAAMVVAGMDVVHNHCSPCRNHYLFAREPIASGEDLCQVEACSFGDWQRFMSVTSVGGGAHHACPPLEGPPS